MDKRKPYIDERGIPSNCSGMDLITMSWLMEGMIGVVR